MPGTYTNILKTKDLGRTLAAGGLFNLNDPPACEKIPPKYAEPIRVATQAIRLHGGGPQLEVELEVLVRRKI